MERQEYTQGLRDLADFLEATPDFPTPDTGLMISLWAKTRPEYLQLERSLGPAAVFHGAAIPACEYIWLTKQFGPHTIQLWLSKGTFCEPITERRRYVREIAEVMRRREEVEEDVVIGWKCEEGSAP